MKKLLVTGGCGFIGSNFVRLQLETYPDVEVTNVDKLTYAGNLENLKDIESDSRYTFAKVDITDAKAVEAVLFGDGGIGGGQFDGKLVVDHSSIHPDATRALATRLEAQSGMHWPSTQLGEPLSTPAQVPQLPPHPSSPQTLPWQLGCWMSIASSLQSGPAAQ